MSTRKKILIVDDHPIFRDGLVRMIGQRSDWVVCAEAGSVAEGLTAMDRHRPDVSIVDISLPDGNGLDLIRNAHIQYPHMKMLVLSTHPEEWYAERVIPAGAHGYVMKQEAGSSVLSALGRVMEGHIALSKSMIGRMINEWGGGEASQGTLSPLQLSDREFEVFRLMGNGFGTQEVATTLHLASSTVESYRANIKQKLNFRSVTALVAYAARFVTEQGTGA